MCIRDRGIRDGGPFRQGIDGGDVEGLAVKAGRPLHGFALALQGIGRVPILYAKNQTEKV